MFLLFPMPVSDIGYPVYSDQSIGAYSVKWFIPVQVKPQRSAGPFFFSALFMICLHTAKGPFSEVSFVKELTGN